MDALYFVYAYYLLYPKSILFTLTLPSHSINILISYFHTQLFLVALLKLQEMNQQSYLDTIT